MALGGEEGELTGGGFFALGCGELDRIYGGRRFLKEFAEAFESIGGAGSSRRREAEGGGGSG